jgi:internalin A
MADPKEGMTKEARKAYNEALRRIEECRREGAGGMLLDLSGMGLTALPPEIGQFTKLEQLRLNNNQLTALPPEIGQLTALTELWLNGNQFTALPPEIGQLTTLTELWLHYNQLTILPPEIGKLAALERLYLFQNRLTTLPAEIGQLTALKRLHLSDNQLAELPPQIGQLLALTELYLHSNAGLGLPAETLGPAYNEVVLDHTAKPKPPREILDYYFAIRGEEGRALREVKLILVGRGEVGKSSMADALQEKEFVKQRERTDGIAITPWEVKLPDGAATVLIWDFGGQEIMHGTHQFFLTHRSLYVVMVDGRHDRQKHDAEYWLKLVRAFGGDSTVLVVMNRQQAHPFDMDRQYLADKYGVKLEHFFRTDCAAPGDIEPVRKAILAQAAKMLATEERFPARCWEVKDRLAEMRKHGEDYLSDEAYAGICAKHGVESPEEQLQLLRRLADLGTVVSFPEEVKLAELSVLNPEWATDGIYRVVTNEELREERHGQLKLGALRQLLPAARWPQPKHLRFMLDLMEKFELCFPVSDAADTMLVPELLPDKTPPLTDWDAAQCVVFLYKYTVLPHGVLPRFITRTHMLSTGRERWRSGVELADDGAEALIKADYDAGQISVWVRGKYSDARRALLKVVRHHFDQIHSGIKDLNPQELVAVPGHPEVTVPYRDLVLDERDGEKTTRVTIDGERLHKPISELLNGVESVAERQKAQAGWSGEPEHRSIHLSAGAHYHEHEASMTHDESISIEGGAHGSAVGKQNTVSNTGSFNSGIHGEELAELFQGLAAQLSPVRDEMKGKDIKVLDEQLAKLTEEAKKPQPDKGQLALSGKGVIEAAQTVGKIAAPVLSTVGLILKFFGVPVP